MSTLLEQLRKKTQIILMSTKDNSLFEQINAIKKNLYVDTTLATLLHSNHFDHKWNPNVQNKIQEHIDTKYKRTRHENIKRAIFQYLDGWVEKEDVDGLTMIVLPSSLGEVAYDPTNSRDYDTITEIISEKIRDIFPLSIAQSLTIAIEYMNPNMFKGEDLWGSLGLKPLNEQTKKELNPKVKPGDHIRVMYIDTTTLPSEDEYNNPYTPPENYSKGKVIEVVIDETPDGEEVTLLKVYFPEMETFKDNGYHEWHDDGVRVLMDPYDKYIKIDEVLTEAGIIGGGSKPRRNIPDSLRGSLVQAVFTREGGWGRPSKKFILFITPTGNIVDIQQSSSVSGNEIPFELEQKVSFGDLYRFEQDSKYDLQMKGRLREHEEQLKLFPTGQWDFTAGMEQEDMDDVMERVPEKIIPYIFKQWDEHGVDLNDMKILGIDVNYNVAVFLLKRWLQNTTKPVMVSRTYDCEDLTNLFDTNNRDYDMGYIEEFLCGKDGFYDHDDWYNYDYDEYMLQDIDEGNWKTISEIFGGVSQEVAEDILSPGSTSEEIDELKEKYDDEIREIESFIVWAHNDEAEYAVKNAMKEDILDKLREHFGADGKLYRSDEDGSWSWYFEDDLRKWVNDGNTWDNIETFEYHPDYAGTTLEDALVDVNPIYLNEKQIFDMLIDEEYMFHDYCEGKKGECLQAETRWFDGYYFPNYDINQSLADRLPELLYKPTVTTPTGETEPLNEQEQRVRVKTIFEDDNWKYMWPINDYSFCQLAKDTQWCRDGVKTFEGYGTSYILQSKDTGEMWKFDDRERVPGLPSEYVQVKTWNNHWLDTHRFLADKPSLHDMFNKTYTVFDKIKYGVKLPPTILEDLKDTNEFSKLVYDMIKNPNPATEEKLKEFLGGMTYIENDYNPVVQSVYFGDKGVSIYYDDSIFKENIMGVDQDDDWYFEIATDKYYNTDHCEELDDEELNYIGYHITPETEKKLDELAILFGEDPNNYLWSEDGVADEFLTNFVPEDWDRAYWEVLEALGCAVGRSRVKAVQDDVEKDKVLDYEYVGSNRYPLWKLYITYEQLLYIVGDKKINNFLEMEDTEINHIDGNLNDVWYEAWEIDDEGRENFNYELTSFIDGIIEKYGDDVEQLIKNREEFKKITKDLGFTKPYSNSDLRKTDEIEGENQPRIVSIRKYDPKDNKLVISIHQPPGGSKTHQITLDQLADYTLQHKLDLDTN